MINRHAFTAAAAAALLGAGAVLLWRPAEPPAINATVEFAPSLRGTTVDGQARQEGGRLVVDDRLRELFDYYLSSYGERSLEQIETEIGAELDRRLPPEAAAEARRVLKRYLAFKRALVALDQDPKLAGNGLDAIQARLDAVAALRAQFFSPAEARAMFGLEESYARDALARLRVQQDSSLSPSERARQLAELDAAAAPEIRLARQAPMQQANLAQAVEAARARGADAAEIHRLRSANVGAAAADRLAVLDREEAAWQQRITTWRADRERILADPSLDAATREVQLRRLDDERFSADEQRRLAAYAAAESTTAK
ncbi:lipase secretion chaperone [Chitinimonas lacunae]|uniref:Lipase chaperone n=1 Tax=Chitinimonas lacunae TaxID=1963018 RepID=A0ABV8MSQ5_9NEIS